jgi:hypothetical protein
VGIERGRLVTDDAEKIDDGALWAFFDPLSRGHHP